MKLPPALVERASRRHGAVLTTELRDAGLSQWAISRRVEAGILTPATRGAYVITAVRDDLSVVAAAQLLHPTLVAEGRTAAAIWGLDGCAALSNNDVDLVDARSHRAKLRIRCAELPPRAITTYQGLRLTNATWTIAALARTASADAVELALESALRRKVTSERRLLAMLAARPTDAFEAALRRRRRGSPPTDSFAETRFLQAVVRPLGLEDPERQVPMGGYRLDFLFRRNTALDVEVDGAEFHGTPRAHEHDTMRDQRLRREGCHVVRFVAGRIERAASEVRRALLDELAAVS